MKITKVNGVRKASKDIGILYSEHREDVNPHVEERIKTANKNSESLYSIFRKTKKKNAAWQDKLNQYIRKNNSSEKLNLNYKNLSKEDIEKALKDPFVGYAEEIHKAISNVFENSLLEKINKVISDEIEKIQNKRIENKITKSIENQKSNYCIKGGNVEFVKNDNNDNWARMLVLSPEKDLDNNIAEIFKLLDDSLFKDIADGKYSEMRKAIYDRKQKYNENGSNDSYFKFWIRKAYDTFNDEYDTPRLKNTVLKTEDVKRKIKGKFKSQITNRLIEYGKAIYHFPGEKFIDYSITSFDMEIIKANETIHQKVNSALLYAISNLALAIGAENDFFLEKKYRGNNAIEIAKFFGGKTYFIKRYLNKDENEFTAHGCDYITQIKDLLYKIRNKHFHYVDSNNKSTLKCGKIENLFHKECELQGEFIIKKYESNDIVSYFSKGELISLVKRIHTGENQPSAFIPAYRSLKKHFPDEYKKAVKNLDEKAQLAANFLMSNIYYNKFLGEKNYESMCLNVENIKPKEKNERDNSKLRAFQDFKNQYKLYEKEGVQALARHLQIETMQANAKNDEDEKHKGHYDILLRQLMADGLFSYTIKNFDEVLKLSPKQDKYDIEDLPINIKFEVELPKDKKELLLGYYVIAKLLPPKALNQLKGDFLKYKQYIDDIKSRQAKAMPGIEFCIENYYQYSDDIIKVLSLCSEASGIVSNNLYDYYANKDEYAASLGTFIEGSITNFKNLTKWDTEKKFHDEENPIIFAQIERSRQNGTFEIIRKIYQEDLCNKDLHCKNNCNCCKYKITIKDLNRIKEMPIYKDKTKQNSKIPLTQKEYKSKTEHDWLVNKTELHNVQKLGSFIIDLFSQLVSWCYIWERDLEYMMLALDKILGANGEKDIKKIFIYGETIQINQIELSGPMGNKLKGYLDHYEGLRLKLEKYFFGSAANFQVIKTTRNEIAHWDYFRKKAGNSLLGYYKLFRKVLGYSPKLKNNVFQKLMNILESYHIIESYNEKKSKNKTFEFKPATSSSGQKEDICFNRGALCSKVVDVELKEDESKDKSHMGKKKNSVKLQLIDDSLIKIIEVLLNKSL